MPLNLYRRHFRTRGKCLGGYEPDFRNYETDELRRGWKKCRCPIYADGTLGGQFKRRNTKQIAWPEARAIAAAWEAVGQWHDEKVACPPPEVVVAPVASMAEGVTIERATAAFLAEHSESSAPNTQKKYGIIIKKFEAHSAAKGYGMIDQWGPIDVREFRHSWEVSPESVARRVHTKLFHPIA